MEIELTLSRDDYLSALRELQKKKGLDGQGVKRAFGAIVLLAASGWFLYHGSVHPAVVFGGTWFLVLGIWLLLQSIRYLFPALYARYQYRNADWSRTFKARFTATTAELDSTGRRWQFDWTVFPIKGESQRLFYLCDEDHGEFWVFGKRFFTPEQQREFRQYAGLPEPAPR